MSSSSTTPTAPLFTVPITTPSSPGSIKPPTSSGSFICTQPAPRVYLLTFSSPPDNRLTPPFLDAFVLSLDIIEHRFPKGVVISTSGIAKFYSNGLNYEDAVATRGFMEHSLYRLFARLLTYPMPTIALFNGHAFAAALMIGMYHDYRVMNPAKGFLCLNEVHFGAAMEAGMVSIFRQKVRDPATLRTLVLEGQRIGAAQAAAEGLVDATGGLDETLALVAGRQLVKMGESGVYGKLKEEIYRETLQLLRQHAVNVGWRAGVEHAKGDERVAAVKRVEEFEGRSGRARL